MDALHLAHLVLLGVWGGLVLAETIVEVALTGETGRAHAARAHFWIDMLAELPVVLGVLVTGGLLVLRVWPPSTWLIVKICAGLAAVAINLYCTVMVVLRYRHRESSPQVERYRARVLLSGLGIPFALVAAWIGLSGYR